LNRKNQLLDHVLNNKSDDLSLLIRHAPRYAIPSGRIGHHDIPLTEKGRQMAHEFGQALPIDAMVRLFHSPIPRCEETAVYIRRGVISNEGLVILMGKRDFLDTIGIVDLKRMVTILEQHGRYHLVRQWLDGKIENTIMRNPHHVVQRTLKEIIASKRDKSPLQKTIDIHITHDLNVLAAREILLGVKLENGEWSKYLDGLVFLHNPQTIMVMWEAYKQKIKN
jgi:hypothetical protein